MTVQVHAAAPVPLLVLEHGAPVRRVPFALARRFEQICTTACAEAVEGAGLTPLEFALMAYINPADGEPDLDQSALSGRLGVDRNSTSLLIAGLERKRLVTRRPSPADRRMRLVRLTTRGERLFTELHPRGLELQQHVLSVLDPGERELLLDLLARVIEANPERARPGSGRRKRTSNGTTGPAPRHP
jgi:DNA-binding MarR family transcriptional regulator